MVFIIGKRYLRNPAYAFKTIFPPVQWHVLMLDGVHQGTDPEDKGNALGYLSKAMQPHHLCAEVSSALSAKNGKPVDPVVGDPVRQDND